MYQCICTECICNILLITNIANSSVWLTYLWKLGPVLKSAKAKVYWIIHSKQITHPALWKCDVTCLFGDLCEWLVALNPTLTETLFTLNKITTQLALFVISFDTLSRGIYKRKGAETKVSWTVFSTLARRWEETCSAISQAPSVLWIKVSLKEDQTGNSEKPWVSHVLKLNEFCKLERQTPMIKTVDDIAPPKEFSSFILNCKFRFMYL